MEIRGVKLKKQTRLPRNSGFFVLKPPEFYSVPLVADDGDHPIRTVEVGQKVKEGTLIAKPNGRYGSYVYSPTSGKVIGVVKKLNASGNECEHVVITRDLDDEKENLKPLDMTEEHDQEKLLKRLYESGIVDNFTPFDPAYKKYLLKCSINSLIINCTEDDPYRLNDTALLETCLSEIIEGAKFLMNIASADNIVFIFRTKQKALAKQVIKYIKQLNQTKLIKVKFYPNVYPLNNSRLIAYYETGKIVPEGSRTAQTSVIVESPNNCYDFYNAVRKGTPCIQRAVTVSGNNCLRKANYFIKNGTPIEHILNVVGVKEQYRDNMLVYGGIMSGVAQETLDISATLTASCILFCNSDEYVKDVETVCINCGKCVAVCPVRLHVKSLDQAIKQKDYVEVKRLKVGACIGCGACSYVCPAKRFLSQRINFAKDYLSGKTFKKPNSSEYILVEGDDVFKNQQFVGFDRILQTTEKFKATKKDNLEIPEIEDMLDRLNKEKGNGGGEDNGK